MTDRFVIDLGTLPGMAAAYDRAPQVTNEEVEIAATSSILQVQREWQQGVRTDTKNYKRSISSEVRPIAGGFEAIAGSNLPYARVEEEGRRPGSAMPPAGVLIRSGWLRRHGIPDSAEFVIRRSIGRKGFPGSHAARNAMQRLRPAINAEFAAVPRRVLRRIGATR